MSAEKETLELIKYAIQNNNDAIAIRRIEQYCHEKTQLSNLIAIQDYLLTRGTNDEEINTKIRELQNLKL